MAEMTAMQAAIAAARKEEKKKEKKRKAEAAGISVTPACTTAEDGTAEEHEYKVDEDVEYWSESKKRWVAATVLGKKEKDGKIVYELDVKGNTTADKLRPRSDSTAVFASFEAKVPKGAKPDPEETISGKPRPPPEPPIDWSDPPLELKSREDFDDRPAEFIEQFVRFFIANWQRERERGFTGLREKDRQHFTNKDILNQMQDDIEPLLKRLRRGEALERGESRAGRKKGARCGARTSCDGRTTEQEANVLEQLDSMATLASERRYSEAHKAYMQLTLGNKTWHNTCVTHVSANTMQGAREYRRNRDDLNTYDVDPVAQKYMQALRKIIQFAQGVRPNEDESKNLLL